MGRQTRQTYRKVSVFLSNAINHIKTVGGHVISMWPAAEKTRTCKDPALNTVRVRNCYPQRRKQRTTLVKMATTN